MKKMKKKGSFGDMIYILLVITVTAFFFIIGWMAMSKINGELQAQDNFSATGKSIMTKSTNRYVAILDNVYLVVLIAMYLGAIILAWQIDAHPIFFALSFIIVFVIIILAGVMGNAFYEFTANAEITSYAEDFTIIPFIMNNIVKIFVIMVFGIAIAMFAKAQVFGQ